MSNCKIRVAGAILLFFKHELLSLNANIYIYTVRGLKVEFSPIVCLLIRLQ